MAFTRGRAPLRASRRMAAIPSVAASHRRAWVGAARIPDLERWRPCTFKLCPYCRLPRAILLLCSYIRKPSAIHAIRFTPCGLYASRIIAYSLSFCGCGIFGVGWKRFGLIAAAGVRSRLLVVWLAITLAGTIALSNPALAGNFTVTNTDDGGPGSLRDAITQANAAGGTKW